MGAVHVAKSSKGGPKSPEPDKGKGSEYTEHVKLRPKFKAKLQRVALDMGVAMGELIERQMEQYVEMESQRIARKMAAGE